MKQQFRILLTLVASSLAMTSGLRGATFTYLNSDNDNVEEYSSAANMAAGTRASSGAFAGALDDFDSLSYDGTNFYATFNTAFITYTSVANIRSNTQASSQTIFNQVDVRGISTSDGNLFWLMLQNGSSDLLIPYSSQTNLRNNTQGLSGQGNGSDNITTTWDVNLVKGMGFDGSDYYVIRDISGSDDDILTVHDTIADVGTDTRLSTTTIDAGAGGTVPNLSLGTGLAVTPVPEPATYGLISGLLLLATAHCRRKNRR